MMPSPGRIVVFQTAFAGDVILTVPLVEALRKLFHDILIDFVAIPSGAEVLANHPALNHVIVYDKKGKDKGLLPALSLARELRRVKYYAALIPHRSLRSAAICCLAGIQRRIGFDTSAGRWLFSDEVRYSKDGHEIARNLSLLRPLGHEGERMEIPRLYPSTEDMQRVSEVVGWRESENLIALAPGSVWATKRWLEERFCELASQLIKDGFSVALVGGREDQQLGIRLEHEISHERLVNVIGKFTLLQSAELIRRAKVLVTNDSAPMHLAVAMRTPVVAIFGATVPAFGFAPLGEHDVVVETDGLKCRPCGIHGGNSCPIKTFDCMKNIQTGHVLEKVHGILSRLGVEVG